MRIASALTKPVRTERDTKRINTSSLSSPNMIWSKPANTVAAKRYCNPWLCAKAAATSATDPAAPEIIAGRPPAKAMTTPMTKEANKPKDRKSDVKGKRVSERVDLGGG